MAKLDLPYDEFERYAKKFVAVSNKLKDGWKERRIMVVSNPERETVFLVKSLSLLLDDDHPLEEEENDHHHTSLEYLIGDRGIEEEDDPAIMNSLGILQNSCSCHSSVNSSSPESSPRVSTSAKSPTSVHIEYHIVHSFSYEVPVLYFNATYSNGRQLSLEDTWRLLSKQFVSRDVDCWGMVSQQEHPILHCPFYHIHPCHTAKVMELATKTKETQVDNHNHEASLPTSSAVHVNEGVATSIASSSDGGEGQGYRPLQDCSRHNPNYLVTWLSMFGPLVGLNLPLEYAKN